ncbi:MAG: hypothetical protein NVS4B12_25070 [Ktedonobacteraceae bacterium]
MSMEDGRLSSKKCPQFGTFKQAQRVQQSDAQQPELSLSTG